jgi:hypothetical protein
VGEFIFYNDRDTVRIGRIFAIVKENGQWCLEIRKTLTFENLPEALKVNYQQSSEAIGELWLSDDLSYLIRLSDVIRTVPVWFKESPKPLLYHYYIREIIYFWNSQWQTRSISLQHQHPSEYMQPLVYPDNMPVKKFFIDLYHDDFGTFRNVYHSLGGIYIQFGNFPFSLRKQLKNHFPIGFVPFGGSFSDFIKPFVKELQELEKGVKMSSLGEEVWVIAGLGSVTGDLPQGNIHAGVKHHNARLGCRSCRAPHEKLTDPSFDLALNARYHHITTEQINQVQQLTGIARSRLATEYGIQTSYNPLDKLVRDRCLHTPHDPYHAIGGKILKLLDATMNLLSASGENIWNTYWKFIEKPVQWSKLPNALSHRRSFMFSDGLRLAMLMPFILRRCLTPDIMKNSLLESLKERLRVSSNQAVIEVIHCWVIVAKTAKLAFSTTITNEIYKQLEKCLQEEQEVLTRVLYYNCIVLSIAQKV